ncbi:MAG: hypothetical protein IJ828_03605 [Treponema sp.]|nr:hypothetical protein [Treponema sp.]
MKQFSKAIAVLAILIIACTFAGCSDSSSSSSDDSNSTERTVLCNVTSTSGAQFTFYSDHTGNVVFSNGNTSSFTFTGNPTSTSGSGTITYSSGGTPSYTISNGIITITGGGM